MSKEHKMTYKGKKYITKIVNGCSCKECAFAKFYPSHVICTVPPNTKCTPGGNKDQQYRVWVEDKSIDKKPIKKYETRIIDGFFYKTLLKNTPKEKNHYWIIEDYIDGEWKHWAVKETRSQARECLYEITEGRPKRIRKFIIAK